MRSKKKVLLVSSLILIFISGCANFFSEPEQEDNAILKIISPDSGDSIGIGNTEINYSISTPASLKFMELYLNGNFTGNYPPNHDGSQPKISLNINENLLGVQINYYLIYYDKNGTSSKSSDVLNIRVVETVKPPEAPDNLILIKLSETSINLSWKDTSVKVDGYEIWRKLVFYGEYFKLLIVSGDVFNINDENLEPGRMYSYKIRGYNQFGFSPFSEEINNFGVGSSGDLYSPTNLISVARGSRLVRLNWRDNSNNENYFAVERKKAGEEFVKVGMVNRNVTQYADSINGLESGGEYYYRIKSFSNSDSAWSNESYAQTYWYDLSRPENLMGIYLGEGKIVLSWDDNDNTNTIFEIERKSKPDEDFISIATIPGNQNSFLDQNLQTNSFYIYRVRSSDGVYLSDYSNEIVVSTGDN